jgi:hypothetical protein
MYHVAPAAGGTRITWNEQFEATRPGTAWFIARAASAPAVSPVASRSSSSPRMTAMPSRVSARACASVSPQVRRARSATSGPWVPNELAKSRRCRLFRLLRDRHEQALLWTRSGR